MPSSFQRSLFLWAWLCPTVAAQGVELWSGLVTQTDVKGYMDLSQDIQEIGALISSNQVQDAFAVYRDGIHSYKTSGVKRSLKGLSNELAAADPKTPSFLFHLYGQAERSLNLAFDSQKLDYINTNVQEIFNSKPKVVVEALWAIDIWMYATHLLYNGVYECERRSQGTNPNMFDVGTAGWDEFIALWVGSGQNPGQDNGDSLYAWTQTLANKMGSDPETQANTRIVLLYQQAISIINVAGSCTKTNPGTAGELWKLVVQTVSEMSKPLFQGLISAMNDKNQDLIAVYSRALVPQMSQCRPSMYKTFHESMIQNTFNGDSSSLFGLIPDMTFCFGYSCADLGNTTIAKCAAFNEKKPVLAGFIPSTPVGNVAKADLDVYQMKVMAELREFDFARYIFRYGANINKYRQGTEALEYVSLYDIAVSSERANAQPWFDMYVSFNSDKDYSANAILKALTGDGGKSKWKATQQVAAIAATTASFQILFFEAMSKLEIAVKECKSADPTTGPIFVLNPIDETAALLIGSMEGERLGGSPDLEDGQLIYNINNKHAFQFGTMNQFQYSNSVGHVEDLLFAAKGELYAMDCANLEQTTEDILRFAMVGIVQGCIYDAVTNAKLDAISTSDSLAEGEGLALSILPIINNKDPATAKSLKDNMVRVQGTKPVPAGALPVAKWFGKGFSESMEMDCSNLGSLPGINPCDGVWGQVSYGRGNGPNRSDALASLAFPSAVAALMGAMALFVAF